MNSEEKEQSLKLAEHYFHDNQHAYAKYILEKIIQIDPDNSKANELLSYIYENAGQIDTSFELLNLACNQSDCSPEALYYLGSIQLKRGLFDQAIEKFKKSISKAGEFFEALHDLATAQANIGDLASAINNYQKCLNFGNPSHELFYNLARLSDELKQFDEAISYYDKALSLKPDYYEAWTNKGLTLHELKRYDEAITHFDKALSLRPDHAESWSNKGLTLHELKRVDEAIIHFDKAVDLKHDLYEAWANKGLTLHKLGRYEEAVIHYDKALSFNPDEAEVWSSKGVALNALRRYKDAFTCYDKALSLKIDYAEGWSNKGIALMELKWHEKAITHFDKALNLKPNYAEGWSNKGFALSEIKHYDEAIYCYDKALSLKLDIDWVLGALVYTKIQVCNWSGLNHLLKSVLKKLTLNERVIQPLPLLALNSDALIQRKSSETYIQSRYPFNPVLGPIIQRPQGQKIRVGYFSADYHNHATGHLIAELFELHDKSQFELVGFSFGPIVNDEMRQRLIKSFDQFIEVGRKSDLEIANLSRDLNIDIAVDLKGFTQDARTGIFAHRAAPIQVNYLGYPGTLGADYIDYIIADKTLIPPEYQSFYSEMVVYLPNSYQVNDRKRFISDRPFTRQELGLPEKSFVFCCFNNNFKILPATFDAWMRILKSVEGSVLWLLEDNALAADNLKKEAVKRGVDGKRLVFADRMLPSDHLARHRQADLFLDTLPYNAHTTASDALWTGLPVLTLMGESFASRVAASLLNAIGLPELIATTQEEYEATAIELAKNLQKLLAIKQKLANNRLRTPLFDTPLFTKNIETAYIKMHERYLGGLEPDHISIQ